jgi:hypothetical protein
MKTSKNDFIKIPVTTNYNMFNRLPMQRPTLSKHVQELVESVRKNGNTRQVICCKVDFFTGSKLTYVIDGDHLLDSCRREGIPVRYEYIEVTDKEDLVRIMACYNNSSKAWQLKDYIHAFSFYNPDYSTLQRYMGLYNLEALMIASICNNTNTYNAIATSSAKIKNGEFKINNPKAKEMCKDFSDLFIKIGVADRWVKKQFLNVFIQAYGSYNHKETLKNIDKYIKTIKVMSDPGHANEFIQKNVFNLI